MALKSTLGAQCKCNIDWSTFRVLILIEIVFCHIFLQKSYLRVYQCLFVPFLIQSYNYIQFIKNVVKIIESSYFVKSFAIVKHGAYQIASLLQIICVIALVRNILKALLHISINYCSIFYSNKYEYKEKFQISCFLEHFYPSNNFMNSKSLKNNWKTTLY